MLLRQIQRVWRNARAGWRVSDAHAVTPD
jgi:hypothetical protein